MTTRWIERTAWVEDVSGEEAFCYVSPTGGQDTESSMNKGFVFGGRGELRSEIDGEMGSFLGGRELSTCISSTTTPARPLGLDADCM
jgi:hypothetical protein